MVDKDNMYSSMQKNFYKNGTTNHLEHNENPDYWELLLGTIKEKDFEGKKALDFGCGKGRNITNMQSFKKFERVDGVDISQRNIDVCEEHFKDSIFYTNNGTDLSEIPSDEYHFVMSTIVLQHIPVHEIRFSLLKEIYRVMAEGGYFNFQMGYGDNLINPNGNDRKAYHDNFYAAKGTNGDYDVRVINEQDLIDDLTKIGFKNVKVFIKDSFSDYGHPKWIYVNCEK